MPDGCLLQGRHVGDLAPLATAAGARVYHIRLVPPGFRFIAGLGRILAEGGYHIVHNHLHALSGPPVRAARKLGIPVITSFHNTVIDSEVATRLPVAAPAINAYARLNVNYALRHSRLVTGCSLGVLREPVRWVGHPGQRAGPLLRSQPSAACHPRAAENPPGGPRMVTGRRSFSMWGASRSRRTTSASSPCSSGSPEA